MSKVHGMALLVELQLLLIPRRYCWISSFFFFCSFIVEVLLNKKKSCPKMKKSLELLEVGSIFSRGSYSVEF